MLLFNKRVTEHKLNKCFLLPGAIRNFVQYLFSYHHLTLGVTWIHQVIILHWLTKNYCPDTDMKKQLLICILLSLFIAPFANAKLYLLPNKFELTTVKYAKSAGSKSISAQQAARTVKSAYGGKVLKVKSAGSSKRPSYRVKLLKDSGHIIYVNVDARTGRILR